MKKSIIASVCGLFMLFAACDNYDNLIPHQYDTVLSMKQYGEQNMTLYRTGEDTKYEITVIKTGSVPDNSAKVNVKAMSEAQFVNYLNNTGKKYKRLPDNCFTIENSTLEYLGEDSWKYAVVSVKFDEAESYVRAEPGNYVIPVVLSSETDSVFAGKNELILKLAEVVTPVVSFSNIASLELPKEGGVVSIPLNMQIDNQWNFSVKVELDEESTTLEGVELENDGVAVFEPGNNGVLNVKVGPMNQISGTIGLKIAAVEGMEFEYGEGTQIVPVKMEKYPLTVEMLSSNAVEPSEGSLANLLDDNIETFFHSAWSVAVDGKHYVQVTLPQGVKKFAFSYTNRSTNANAALIWFNLFGGANADALTLVKGFNWDTDALPWNVPAGVYESPVLEVDSPVQVLRFENNAGAGFNAFFVWSEFSLYVWE